MTVQARSNMTNGGQSGLDIRQVIWRGLVDVVSEAAPSTRVPPQWEPKFRVMSPYQ